MWGVEKMGFCRSLWVGASAFVLSSCGGGDSPTPKPSPPPSPPVVSLPVTLSATSANISVGEGESASLTFNATYTGSSSDPVIADVQINGRRILLDGAPSVSDKTFTVGLETVPFPAGGRSDVTVTFRLCKTSACNTVYGGSTKVFTIDLNVELSDWMTLQRNASHTGYVAARYNVADFKQVWSADDFVLAANGIAATRGGVFATVMNNAGEISQRRIDPANGSTMWTYSLVPASYMSAPFYANGLVASMAMDISSGEIPMQVLNAQDGRYRTTISYSSQFSPGGTPTPFDGKIYFQAGYFGNVVYGADPMSGNKLWETDTTQGGRGYVMEGQSVGVDTNSVYYFGGGDLVILSRATGAETKRIPNPFFSGFGTSYSGTYAGGPILDGEGRIFTFTDNRVENQPRALMAWSVDSSAPLWRSANTYVDDPAYHAGRLYAPRANSAVVDVLDAENGSLIRSIPMSSGSESLQSNVVLTERHMFVATANTTYAIDLSQSGDPVVWSAPFGGELAITPDNVLVVIGRESIRSFALF